MNYKCYKCNGIFDEDSVDYKQSYLGEYGMRSVYEHVSCCPCCGSTNFYEVEECEICGEYEYVDELHCGVCEKCIKKITPRECFNMISPKKSIEINEYLAECFSVSDIEHILLTALEEQGASTVEFTSSDKEWFAEKLLERKEENK